MTRDLKDLRNKVLDPTHAATNRRPRHRSPVSPSVTQVNFAFFMFNALWLVATLTLQLNSDTFAIKLPVVTLPYNKTTQDVKVEPISFMFILAFAFTVVIQFLTMICHR